MLSYENNFTGAGFGYSAEQNNCLNFHGYPSYATNSGSSVRTIDLNSNARIAGPSTAATENWWLGPSSNGDSSQYSGSTVIDASWNGFVDQYNFQAGLVPDNRAVGTSDADGSDVHTQWLVNIPERQWPSVAGPSTVNLPALPPSLPPATPVGPTTIPSPPAAPYWGYSPVPTTSSIATGNHRSGMYDQPLSTPNSGDQWSCQIFVGKGKATDYVPPSICPAANDNTAWQDQQPHTPQHYNAGPNLYTDIGVPNTDLSTAVTASTGPRRSKIGTARKGKETEEVTGMQKRAPKRTLSQDINWARTCDRFYWEMIQCYLLQPSGGLPTPEAAYAQIKNYIKEDLHRSPLAVKELGVNSTRELEQYLIGILDVLYPAREGVKRDIQQLLDQVAKEIERGLFMVNDAVALRDGPSKKGKPENLDDSAKGVRRRRVEKERRDASHETLKRMSFFFEAPPRSLSRNEVLFFAITYLIFGVEVFGNEGFVIALPRL